MSRSSTDDPLRHGSARRDERNRADSWRCCTAADGWLSMCAECIRRRAAPDDGQSLVEFAVLAPFLIVLLLGIVEAANAYDRQHAIEGLAREGANLASRGATFEEVVDLVTANGGSIGLAGHGGTVVSRVRVVDGLAEIVGQDATPGFLGRSLVGSVGESAPSLEGLGLVEGGTIHVVEVFYRYDAFTPLGSFVEGAIPRGLYTRAVF